MSMHSTKRNKGRKSPAQRWDKMLSKFATVVGVLALAVAVALGSAAQSEPAAPSAEQQALAYRTSP